jgi:hypothetical protein
MYTFMSICVCSLYVSTYIGVEISKAAVFAHMRNLRQSDFEYSLSKTFKSGIYINVYLHKCINMYTNVHLHVISAFDDIRTITLVYIHIFTSMYAHIQERQLKITNQNYVEKKLVKRMN